MTTLQKRKANKADSVDVLKKTKLIVKANNSEQSTFGEALVGSVPSQRKSSNSKLSKDTGSRPGPTPRKTSETMGLSGKGSSEHHHGHRREGKEATATTSASSHHRKPSNVSGKLPSVAERQSGITDDHAPEELPMETVVVTATAEVMRAADPSPGVTFTSGQQGTSMMGNTQMVFPSVGHQPLGGPGSNWMPGWSPYFMPPWWFMPSGANPSTVTGWQWPFTQMTPTMSGFGGCATDPAVVSATLPAGQSMPSNQKNSALPEEKA